MLVLHAARNVYVVSAAPSRGAAEPQLYCARCSSDSPAERGNAPTLLFAVSQEL